MKNFVFLIVFLPMTLVNGQNTFMLKAQIKKLSNKTVYLLEFYGLENNLVDSVKANSAGFFSFMFDENTPVGLYRLILDGKRWDFIYNKEDITLYSNYDYLVDSMEVKTSVENKLLNDYLKFLRDIEKKRKILDNLKDMYNVDDIFYERIEEELINLEIKKPREYVNNLVQNNSDSFVARFLKSEQYPLINDSIPNEDQHEFIKEHMFDNVDFNDIELIRSPVYIQKVRTYFSLYNNTGNFDEIEQTYIKALDRLMSKAAVNEKVFNFILEDITNGFENSEYELFFVYLTENYLLESSCKNEEQTKELKERLELFKKMAVGNIAPEINIILEDSTKLVLSEMEAPYKLVIFWAAWCGHCKNILPAIKNIYHEFRSSGFEVLAISLDNEEYEWNKIIKEGNYDWINYSELSGWNGSVALDYGIRATPTIFLLDKKNTIILKPRTADQLKRKLKQLTG